MRERREDDVGAAVQGVEVGGVGDDGDAGAAGLAQPRRRLQPRDDQREGHALRAQLGCQTAHEPARRVAVGAVHERADEQQAHGHVVARARAAVVDRVLGRQIDRQRHRVGLHAQGGQPVAVAVVDRHRQGALEQVTLVPAAGRRLEVGGQVAQRAGRGGRLAEAARDLRQVDDRRQLGDAVVRRVQGLGQHRLGLPLRDHLVDEAGEAARAPGAHQRDRRDQPPAGGHAAPARRGGCARRRDPHVGAELTHEAQVGVLGRRADRRDLVRARGRAQQRQRPRVRARERRVGQLGQDEEDAHRPDGTTRAPRPPFGRRPRPGIRRGRAPGAAGPAGHPAPPARPRLVA